MKRLVMVGMMVGMMLVGMVERIGWVTVEEWEAEEYARWLDVVEGEQE